MEKIKNIGDFFKMYVEGFKNLSKTSKILWTIIIVKLFIMFAVMRAFLFPNFLNSKFDTEEEKAEYVIEQITNN
ncbi:MAG: DUF4492 domain-containing protein [Candidatus Symbiothrix sp.]|jgi:flagellar basal body-associated protein FliL|nr:DUF4492 domain-containing protein [Candidatus Symbiothrix sp.]